MRLRVSFSDRLYTEQIRLAFVVWWVRDAAFQVIWLESLDDNTTPPAYAFFSLRFSLHQSKVVHVAVLYILHVLGGTTKLT